MLSVHSSHYILAFKYTLIYLNMLSDTGPVKEDVEIIAKLRAAGMTSEYLSILKACVPEFPLNLFLLDLRFDFKSWGNRIRLNWVGSE